jgi:predicted small secreted protein
MKVNNFLAGVLTGVAAGIVVSETIDRLNKNVSADTVLNTVKEAFKTEGPIDGSWIVMKTEPFKNNVISMDVYRGGISRIKNGELEQFEFAADAKTGTVVELVKR